MMNQLITPEIIVEKFGLVTLEPEGGMFRSSYRSERTFNDRDLCNAIFYLLYDDVFSHLHRLPSDEIYHFYYGDPMEILELSPDGTSRHIVLGNNYLAGHVPQAVIRANTWHGSRVVPGGSFAFVGTSMSPGFDERDYEHCENPEQLIASFPQHEALIRSLTGAHKD
ncbi:MAG TPA: cupin domain-containing protein [Clostridiaceae bacterium]|nr:cupin domain-containing protein [Clostridiaceae bacterium]